MNPNKIKEVRKLVEQVQTLGKKPHYSDEIKFLAKQLLKDGVSLSELASGTGISRGTLVNWTEHKLKKNKFRKLRAVKESPLSPIKISLPGGVSIECMEVALIKNILEQIAS
jgi:DNA invertase Pin-like site-specific DNA recombinase